VENTLMILWEDALDIVFACGKAIACRAIAMEFEKWYARY